MIIQQSLINPQRICGKKDEWFTPRTIIHMVRTTLGEIRHDLASCATANEIVQAEHYFSAEKAFQDHHNYYYWQENFWCNPPFSQCKDFAQILSKDAIRGIAITNANTDAAWWQSLARYADYIQFLDRRVAFIDPATGRPVSGNPKGQSLFFWGCTPEHFRGLGLIMEVKA